MIGFLITLGIIWIVLKITTLVIEVPFRILGALFTGPLAGIFWVILIIAFICSIL